MNRRKASKQTRKPLGPLSKRRIAEELRMLIEELESASGWAVPFSSYNESDEIIRNRGRIRTDPEYARKLEQARQDIDSRGLWCFRVQWLLWECHAYTTQHCEEADLQRLVTSRIWQILIVHPEQRGIYFREQCLTDLQVFRKFIKFLGGRHAQPRKPSPAARRLKKLREALHMKQEQIAEMVHWPQPIVSRVETGHLQLKGKKLAECEACIRKLQNRPRAGRSLTRNTTVPTRL